ncbi:alkyl hydroperoxide reductase [Geomonas limicola]|uniref:Alkyl hydroperoxide reductase n=1 Tax=Geomonas limicola TaxID=2740186 RepID=A0A6V8NBA7_9BACT|nr:TlpA disulfide reductase family protein [Geomonas limicola]GFO69791.1 alkyl hydroperoxide reductase [Geomonas limicola]
MARITTLIVAALLYQAIAAPVAKSIEVGEPVPEFGLRTLDGEVISRTSLAGHPLLIFFWNTRSSNARKALPLLNHMAEKLGQKGITVLAINTGQQESEERARSFWKQHHFLFAAGYDRYLDLREAFGIRQTPTVMLVDAWGIVRYKSPILPNDLESRMRELYER